MVQNQALLGPMGGAGCLGRVGVLHRLGRIALQRRDGPPAAVSGGQVVGGRHDSPESEGGKKEAPRRRLSLSPSITWPRGACPSASLPPSSLRECHYSLGEWGRGVGDPGSSFPPPPLGRPLPPARETTSPLGSHSMEGFKEPQGSGPCPPNSSYLVSHLQRLHHC